VSGLVLLSSSAAAAFGHGAPLVQLDASLQSLLSVLFRAFCVYLSLPTWQQTHTHI